MAFNQVGLELLYSSVKNQITSPSDVVVCSIHWSLISNGFRCIGLGETAVSGTVVKSEHLPEGWSHNHDVYIMRYIPDDDSTEIFMLKVMRMGDTLLVNLMRHRDERVNTVSLKMAEFAGDDTSAYQGAFHNTRELNRLVLTDIIIPFSSHDASAGPSSPRTHPRPTATEPMDRDDLRIFPPPRHTPDVFPTNPQWVNLDDPLHIGYRDLDPLGGAYAPGSGGGMLMDPFRSPHGMPGFDPRQDRRTGLPRGSIPPGARFDPINPPGIPYRPNPDHLPPPGYDDMFM